MDFSSQPYPVGKSASKPSSRYFQYHSLKAQTWNYFLVYLLHSLSWMMEAKMTFLVRWCWRWRWCRSRANKFQRFVHQHFLVGFFISFNSYWFVHFVIDSIFDFSWFSFFFCVCFDSFLVRNSKILCLYFINIFVLCFFVFVVVASVYLICVRSSMSFHHWYECVAGHLLLPPQPQCFSRPKLATL